MLKALSTRRIIPCLLLDNRSFVKTKRFKNPVYIGDPVNTINLFNKFEADEIAILDITSSKNYQRPDFEFIEELASECWVPLTYGGKIRSMEDGRKILNLGVEKIVVESLLFINPNEVKKCVQEFGASSVVGCLNVSRDLLGRYKLCTQGKSKKAPIKFSDTMAFLTDIGVGEVIINDVSRDGTGKGYDLNLIQFVSKQMNCPVIALGGAARMSDFKNAIDSGADAACAGSCFVFQNMNQESVLVNYPSYKEIEGLFDEQ